MACHSGICKSTDLIDGGLMTDDAFEKYELVWTAIHDLVDEMLKNESANDAYDIRDKLTNEFRFWKRDWNADPQIEVFSLNSIRKEPSER